MRVRRGLTTPQCWISGVAGKDGVFCTEFVVCFCDIGRRKQIVPRHDATESAEKLAARFDAHNVNA